MARAADIRLIDGFFEHPKTIKLSRRLGDAGVIALQKVWLFAGKYRTSGSLAGMDAEELAIAARWPGDPNEFKTLLVEIGFLDEDVDGTLTIHGWAQWNPWAASFEKRSKLAQRAARARWNAADDAASMHAASEVQCEQEAAPDASSNGAGNPHVINGGAPSSAPSSASSNAEGSASSNAPSPLLSDTDSSTGTASVSASSSRHPAGGDAMPDDFLRYWKIYPRHDKKKLALKAWLKLSSDDREAAIMDVPLRVAANWAGRTRHHHPLSADYLNERQFEDELETNQIVAPASPLFTQKRRELIDSIQRDQAKETANGRIAS